MRILIGVASRHGATLEIGQVLEAALRTHGLDVDLQRVEEVSGLGGYDAVVLGSGVYSGHWLRPAREFAEVHEGELKHLPVWLFSSGPVGEPLTPMENPAEVATISHGVGARGHRLFGGKIESSELALGEKALVALVRAPAGDYRPWSEIDAWAESIASQLQEQSISS
jgi:menaquinone-dependent protoporphyrinogen oxidase